MANPENKYCVLYWTEEDKTSVVALSNIKEPRKPFSEYSPGDKVRARCPGFAGTFPAVIREVAYQSLLDTSSLAREDKLEELKIMFLEEEIKELRHFQREAKNRTAYLTQVLEQSEEQRKRQHGIIESMRYQLTQAGMYSNLNQLPAGEDPLSHPETRPNSLPEAEAIIRHLQKLNEQQSHELDRMKSDLRDVLYSHKWTPDAYLIAKAYIAEDDLKIDSGNGQNGLPRLQIKSKSRKLPDIAYIQKDNVTLPALKHSVSNKAMERKKRSQILQKARLH